MDRTNTPTPEAVIWWSTTRAAWGCQIGNARSYHYNEADAMRYGAALAATVRSGSQIVGEWQ